MTTQSIGPHWMLQAEGRSAVDSGIFSSVLLIYKDIQILLPWVREESHHWSQCLCVHPLELWHGPQPTAHLLRQYLGELQAREAFLSAFFVSCFSFIQIFLFRKTKQNIHSLLI